MASEIDESADETGQCIICGDPNSPKYSPYHICDDCIDEKTIPASLVDWDGDIP